MMKSTPGILQVLFTSVLAVLVEGQDVRIRSFSGGFERGGNRSPANA